MASKHEVAIDDVSIALGEETVKDTVEETVSAPPKTWSRER